MSGAATVDWLPALGILAGGLALGAVATWRSFAEARRAGRGQGDAGAVRDLAGKRDALVRQLQELEDTASKRTGTQLAQERYALELEAAQVLLALDGQERARESRRAAPAPKAERPPAPGRRAQRAVLWALGSATAVLLLGFFAFRSAKPREAGGSVTGDVPGRSAAAEPSADEAAIQAALARNPDDVDARLQMVRTALGKHDYMAVWNETGRILQKEPGNPRALSYQALVRIGMGQPGIAADMLREALAADPEIVEAWASLALAEARMGRLPAARATISQASKRFPQQEAEMERLLSELESETKAAGSAPGEADLQSSLATPTAAPAPAAAGRHVSGVVELDASLRSKVAPGAILFVFARAARASGGPPIAVKRLPATFPAAFDLGEGDSMMGQAFPDKLLIEARLDSDGDPTTRAPEDPKARLDDVRSGRTDLRLVLKTP